MPITEFNNVTMDNITQLSNISSLPEFVVKVNYYTYGGAMVFWLLCAAWLIMFIAAQRREDQILSNALYTSAVISVVAIFMRFVYFTYGGIQAALLTDVQMWIFPITTAILGLIIWQSDGG